jgi:hypothetical protein
MVGNREKDNDIIICIKERWMYSNRDKIVKKGDAKTTEIEDEVAKALFELENTTKDEQAETIKKIKLASAAYVADKSDLKVLLIVVPFPLYTHVRKCYATTVAHLERKFGCRVVIVAQRRILSRYGTCPTLFLEKRKGSQKRPHNRTLTAVHDAYLEDIVNGSLMFRSTHSRSSAAGCASKPMALRSTRSTFASKTASRPSPSSADSRSSTRSSPTRS